MAHEKIYADCDPFWHTSDPETEPDQRDRQPGMGIQWHEGLGGQATLGVQTGDLHLEFDTTTVPTVDLSGFDIEHDGNLAAQKAVDAAIQAAYEQGVRTPCMVWLTRSQANHAIKTLRRGRNANYGADE